ncbi:hypothetical protein GJAV_G00084740 [Gymnothorax javanicus]|nr:hypothetical protein GJAV_G00084740 [Gymnothorax javanicus]
MSGKWYLVGYATNAEWFTRHRTEMKVLTVTMTPTEGGDLAVSHASLKSDGSCLRTSYVAKKSDTPGRFTFRSPVWNNDNDMRIADVKYEEYALIHTTKTKAGVSDILASLYTRAAQPSPELVKKFQEFSKEATILAENIVILPKNDECPEA